MDSKQLWTTIIVALVVAVITSLVTSFAVGPQLSPTSLERSASVGGSALTAHACNADGVCETNTVKVENQLLSQVQLSGEEFLSTNALATEAIVTEVSRVEQILTVGQPGTPLDQSFFSAESGVVEVDGALILDGIFQIPDFGEFGVSYACFSPAGTMYRSPTPCV